MLPVTLGQFIRARRAHKRDTQKQAAAKVGVDELTFGRWERGQLPTLKSAYKLAAYLGVTLEKMRPYVDRS